MSNILVKKLQKLGNSYYVRISNKEAIGMGLMLGSYVNISPTFQPAATIVVTPRDDDEKAP
jgi:hypothetical protein